jgi:hypothetical protein
MKAIDFKKDVVKQSVLSYGDTITGSADEIDSVISNASMTGIRKSRAQMKTRRQKRKEGTWSAGEEAAFNTGDLGELDTGYKRIAAL